jgi:hypothetical protein
MNLIFSCCSFVLWFIVVAFCVYSWLCKPVLLHCHPLSKSQHQVLISYSQKRKRVWNLSATCCCDVAIAFRSIAENQATARHNNYCAHGIIVHRIGEDLFYANYVEQVLQGGTSRITNPKVNYFPTTIPTSRVTIPQVHFVAHKSTSHKSTCSHKSLFPEICPRTGFSPEVQFVAHKSN